MHGRGRRRSVTPARGKGPTSRDSRCPGRRGRHVERGGGGTRLAAKSAFRAWGEGTESVAHSFRGPSRAVTVQ